MNFVQPYILWGLPLVGLPILIHLLNRLRFRSVKWAAMIFLLSATKSSIRRARLRHYLILALRTLAVLFLLLALARPIAGGWLGAIAGGAPETIFLVLDRSASMETLGRNMKSLRQHGLEMFEDGAAMIRGNVRFVLAENATLAVQEIPGTESLEELSLCRATSSAADMPALFAKVLEYAVENRCGDMEIWVASDMQASNWRTGSPEWSELKDKFGALPQHVRVRILSLVPPPTLNTKVALKGSRRVTRPSGDNVTVSVRIEQEPSNQEVKIPVGLSVGGVRQQEEIEIDGAGLWLMRSVPLAGEQKKAGWGMVDVPSDGNDADNRCYFTYGSEMSQLAVLVSGATDAGRFLRIASAPDPDGMNQVCLQTSLQQLNEVQWNGLSMLVWQDGGAGDTEAMIEAFCRKGGTVVMFPPARSGESILGMEWSAPETAPEGGRFSVVSWESMEGPLARTGDGKDLPVAAMEVYKRQVVGQLDDNIVRLRTYASYRDGKPFLLGGKMGRGHVYICTTLPAKGWSDMNRGTVLVPMMQRMLSLGSGRLGGADNDSVGPLWRSESDWVCVDEDEKNPCCDAGVYRIGVSLLALNTPESEFMPDVVEQDDVKSALIGLDVDFVDGDVGKDGTKSASEIWPVFIFLMAMALLGEAALLSGERMIMKDESETGAVHPETAAGSSI